MMFKKQVINNTSWKMCNFGLNKSEKKIER